MWHRRNFGILALVALFACLLPRAGTGGPPVPEQFGRVLDAATDRPIARARVLAVDAGSSFEDVGPSVSHTTTDSLGKYTLSLWGMGCVVYFSWGYEPLRLLYPEDLADPNCENCCGWVKDVKLRPLQK